MANNSSECARIMMFCLNFSRDPDCNAACPFPLLSSQPFSLIPTWEVFFKSFLYFWILVLAIVGNTSVIGVVIATRRLHTTTNYFIVNLAVSDLAVTLCNTWTYLLEHLDRVPGTGALTDVFFCKINSFSQVMAVTASTLTLTLIACDRFFGIIFAMKAHFSERRASAYILLVWGVAAVCGAPILFARELVIRRWKDYVEVSCEEVNYLSSLSSKKMYFSTLILLFYFLPAVVMTIAYSCIVYRVWSAQRPGEQVPSTRRAANPSENTNVVDMTESTSSQNHSMTQMHRVSPQSVQERQRRKVIMMLVLILLIFYICWTPLQLTVLFDIYEINRTDDGELPTWYRTFQFVATTLAYTNSYINPLLFAGYNENFRKAIREILGRCPGPFFRNQNNSTGTTRRNYSEHHATTLNSTRKRDAIKLNNLGNQETCRKTNSIVYQKVTSTSAI